jgi:ATP-dependent helicase Lhr and Lhr-like helicase
MTNARAKKAKEAAHDENRTLLPSAFRAWFEARGWQPRRHQLELLRRLQGGHSTLLIAPTGAGKTLAGFLPTLVDLWHQHVDGTLQTDNLHTLYISPLKALAVDVHRNLEQPLEGLALPVRCETRTGDTPVNRRQRQRTKPPHILMTTPEQIGLLLSHPEAAHMFGALKTIVLDELHALAPNKRGDLLALHLASLRRLAPRVATIGLSATVARPSELRAYLMAQSEPKRQVSLSEVIHADPGAGPDISILELEEPVPWSGHSSRYALASVYEAIAQHQTTIVFVNTRMQAELVFQNLWHLNENNLAIALHHGSLDVAQRRKVEGAMAEGKLRAVVATSTLDLGLDWGNVDQVIHIGAPKGASRLLQRIGRANHRLDEPSKAMLVPANRFEVLECRAAVDAARAGEQDQSLYRNGGIDVLAQYLLGRACQEPFLADAVFQDVCSASPYATLTRPCFDEVLDFVATGGYALKSYDRFAKLRQMPDGHWRLAHPRLAQQHRMNAGTIVETPMIKVRFLKRRAEAPGTAARPLLGGRVLGEVEEAFIDQLRPGDTFAFAGEILRFESLRETEAVVTRSSAADPAIPSYNGGKFPLSTHLARRVREMLADRSSWDNLPTPVSEWLALQEEHALLPGPNDVLVETFPRAKRHYLTVYPFEGRLAHQTLGMLLSRRLERAGARPVGFVANDYGLALWCLSGLSSLIARDQLYLSDLFDEDMLGDDLEAWLAESSLMKRTFRHVAVIAGLIERRHPGREKSGRQVTVSTDLIYDVLRKHEPGHVLLQAAWDDAATGLLDLRRLADFLSRIRGRIRHVALERVSPLSVPILLEIGKEPVGFATREDVLKDAARLLVEEAQGR